MNSGFIGCWGRVWCNLQARRPLPTLAFRPVGNRGYPADLIGVLHPSDHHPHPMACRVFFFLNPERRYSSRKSLVPAETERQTEAERDQT